MTHPLPIIELVPLYRCPVCADSPQLVVQRTMGGAIRYLKCHTCAYRHKANLRLACIRISPAVAPPPELDRLPGRGGKPKRISSV